jgi:hypothetical protein
MIPAKINDVYYDFYLMHDFNYWYGMFISRETVDTMNFTQLSFDINKKFNTMYIDDATTLGNEEMDHTYKLDINGEIFYLDYVASDSKILINRLKYVDAGGENHFDATDIIAMTLTNNKRLKYRASKAIGRAARFSRLFLECYAESQFYTHQLRDYSLFS